jgi:hypothetical protein
MNSVAGWEEIRKEISRGKGKERGWAHVLSGWLAGNRKENQKGSRGAHARPKWGSVLKREEGRGQGAVEGWIGF